MGIIGILANTNLFGVVVLVFILIIVLMIIIYINKVLGVAAIALTLFMIFIGFAVMQTTLQNPVGEGVELSVYLPENIGETVDVSAFQNTDGEHIAFYVKINDVLWINKPIHWAGSSQGWLEYSSSQTLSNCESYTYEVYDYNVNYGGQKTWTGTINPTCGSSSGSASSGASTTSEIDQAEEEQVQIKTKTVTITEGFDFLQWLKDLWNWIISLFN